MSTPLVRAEHTDGSDITVPLLDPEAQPLGFESSANNDDIVSPLPICQMSILSFASIAEPVCVNFVYPFVNEMLAEMSNGPKQLAYRSGIFFGCFSLAQFSCVYFWGRLSDRTGRKYVLLMCLACGILSTAAFGVSKTFGQALISRMITGASYGDVPVLRSAVGDITDSTNQGRAFSFLTLAWMIGSILAPLMGGFLTNPAQKFPRIFGTSIFLIDHPYVLPCFASCTLSSLAFIALALFFRETLEGESHHNNKSRNPELDAMKVDRRISDEVVVSPNEGNEHSPIATPRPQSHNYRSTSQTSVLSSIPLLATNAESTMSGVSLSQEASLNNPSPPSAFKILSDPIVWRVLLSYFLVALIATSNDVVFALWMFLDIKDGGVGFSPAQIATAFSVCAILGTLIMTFIFPALHRRVGTLFIYRGAMLVDIVFICLYPVVYSIAKRYEPTHEGRFRSVYGSKDESGETSGVGVWEGIPVGVMIGVGVMLVLKAFSSTTWGCVMILVTASAPTPRSLGTVNSIAQMAACLARGIGPPIYSSLFAISMGKGVVGDKGMVWITMGVMASFSLLFAFFVSEGERDWRRSRRAEQLEG